MQGVESDPSVAVIPADDSPIITECSDVHSCSQQSKAGSPFWIAGEGLESFTGVIAIVTMVLPLVDHLPLKFSWLRGMFCSVGLLLPPLVCCTATKCDSGLLPSASLYRLRIHMSVLRMMLVVWW